MKKTIKYFCKDCNEILLEKDVNINSLEEIFCLNCGAEIEEINN